MTAIATRKMESGDGSHRVLVTIISLNPVADDLWEAWWNISDDQNSTDGKTCGADGLQALQLCFDAIRNELQGLDPTLRWQDLDIESAFPAYLPVSFGEAFYTKIKKLVDDQVDQFVASNAP